MCHSDDSRPPAPPASFGIAERRDHRLTAADGASCMAFTAVPAQPNQRAVVILPDVRGLHGYYRELAAQFADAGFLATAIDYYGRTADTDERDEGFEWQPHIARVGADTLAWDVAAAIAHLRRSQPDGLAVFTVGFCYGGSASWRQAAQQHDIAGAIGFYGGRPVERVGGFIPRMTAPLLMLLAGADTTPAEEFAEFGAKARAAGVTVESHTYAGAPHSFFDRSFTDHRPACDDSWRRILDFTDRHTGAKRTSDEA